MYERHFGLHGKPFQMNPDPAFVYPSSGHARAMAYLEYGVYAGEGFVVVTGEVGAGKTTLVQRLLAKLDPRRVAAAHLVSTRLDGDDLLYAVAAAFGVPASGRDKTSVLARLEAHFTSLMTADRRALLVVDEAQNLTVGAVEELRMLSNYQLGPNSLLQSFLVGQPELRDLLGREAMKPLRQRVLAAYHLGPLEPAETRRYVEHRLARVGWKNVPAFDDDAFPRIHAASGGVPRAINAICNRLLLAAYLADRRSITAAQVAEVAGELHGETGEMQRMQSSSQVASPTAERADDAGTRAVLERLDRRLAEIERLLRATHALAGGERMSASAQKREAIDPAQAIARRSR